MEVTVKVFNKYQRRVFHAMNCCLLILSIFFFVAHKIAFGMDSMQNSKVYAWLFLFGIVSFTIINVVKVVIEVVIKKNIEKNVSMCLQKNDLKYLEEYLFKVSSKKNFTSNANILLYYIAYYNLLVDKVRKAEEYFEKIKFSYLSFGNVYYYEATFFLKIIVNFQKKDGNELITEYDEYLSKKAKILKMTKNNKDILMDFNIIDNIKDGDYEKAKKNLKETRFIRIPFVLQLTI